MLDFKTSGTPVWPLEQINLGMPAMKTLNLQNSWLQLKEYLPHVLTVAVTANRLIMRRIRINC